MGYKLLQLVALGILLAAVGCSKPANRPPDGQMADSLKAQGDTEPIPYPPDTSKPH